MYKLCQQYGVLILEDDPYFYLQFKRGPGGTPGGLQNLGASYLSLDTDGRVIRLDSFAKVFILPFSMGVAFLLEKGSDIESYTGVSHNSGLSWLFSLCI